MSFRSYLEAGAALCAVVGLVGCGTPDPGTETESESDTESTTESGTGGEEPPINYDCDELMLACNDESTCGPLASDYQPRTNNSADDTWPACVSDGGAYNLVDSPPSSIARVEAFDVIAQALWKTGSTPTSQDFTDARAEYLIPEGLESRVVRREDLHYDPVPEEDWDPMVDPDKQCSVLANVEKYPLRCAGPAQIAPMVNDAFVAGENGDGDPNVNAAKIEAALLWFLYISTYKEANTCATSKAKDCDSAWAYYTGGNELSGGIGLAGEVRAISEYTHGRIWDGVLAVRCWRDLTQDGDDYPLLPDVPTADQDQFYLGWEQLDQALHKGFALVVRERLIDHVGNLQNGGNTDATWAFLQIAGPVLSREANERDSGSAATLDALWDSDGSDEAALAEGLTTLDTIFDCA